MVKRILLGFMVLFLISCNNESEENVQEVNVEDVAELPLMPYCRTTCI